MKKVILSAAALFLGTAIHAESCATSVQGFYAGVNAGLQQSSGTTKWDFSGQGVPSKHSVGKKTFTGGLFAGYQMGVGSCAIIGGEIYGNFANYNETIVDDTEVTTPTSWKDTLSSKLNFGAKVRLGYTMSPRSIFFLGIGLEHHSTTLRVERVRKAVGGNPAPAAAGEDIIKKTKKGIKLAPSVGVDLFANDKLFIRAEYTYVFPISMTIEQPFVNGGGNTVTSSHKVKFNNSRFTLGVGYKF
jgi:opacity protein-like surface antigen